MRGAPHVGFSATIRKIKARISLLTGLRPPLDLALESHFQYSRNPARCRSNSDQAMLGLELFEVTMNRFNAAAFALLMPSLLTLEPMLKCALDNADIVREASRVENRRSGISLPVAIGVLSHDPPQSGLA